MKLTNEQINKEVQEIIDDQRNKTKYKAECNITGISEFMYDIRISNIYLKLLVIGISKCFSTEFNNGAGI
jgi:hypothetical protein